jgi:hypothetical protein
VGAPPEGIQDQGAGAADGIDVVPAGQKDGPIRREVLDGARVLLKGLAEADGLRLQHPQVLPVQDLRLFDSMDLEVGVERHVEVNDLVDEPLDPQVVDQELELGDLLLGALGVVRHWSRSDRPSAASVRGRREGAAAGVVRARTEEIIPAAAAGRQSGRGAPRQGPSSVAVNGWTL